MRNFKYYLSILVIIGLFIGMNSNSFAEEKYTIDDQSIQNLINQTNNFGTTEIEWKAKVKNNTDKPITFDVTVDFLNSDNEKLGETSKTRRIPAGKSKVVSNKVLLSSSKVKEIISGYVVVTKVEESFDKKPQTITAKISSLKKSVKNMSDKIQLAYNIKLKNNTDKPLTRDITVAFLDEDNNRIGSETRTTSSFNAWESKVISDTMILNATAANKIATGHVIIN